MKIEYILVVLLGMAALAFLATTFGDLGEQAGERADNASGNHDEVQDASGAGQ